MAQAPKTIESDTEAILEAWQELAPTATFAGMTLEQYQTAVQPSLDARQKIKDLETDLKAQQDARDQADVATRQANASVVKSVVADKNYGDDSALYEQMGYVRKSARQSGLTRKKQAAQAAGAK